MSLYSVKVSLKLRAGVAQRPIFAGGNYHCYNVVDGHIFDLTSEQFGGEVLCYQGHPEQSRQAHFAKEEKYQRYLLLKQRLREACGAADPDRM